MRLLAVDAGNSRIKWGVHSDGQWLERGTVATAEADRLTEAFAALERPQRVIAAAVAGEQTRERISAVVALLGLEPLWVRARAEQCGVRSSYAQPEQLGADRWAALIGARHLHPGAAVVVNAGTTMTVDALSSEGIFLGGFIVPGYTLMRKSMARETALLAFQEGRFGFFPDNTGDAIASGALNALAGAVERMTRYMDDAGERGAALLVSGGDAGLIEPLLSEPRVVDNLVLEGLVQIGTRDV